MFKLKKTRDKSGLEKAIDDLHQQMDIVVTDHEEYAKLVTMLTELYKLREFDTRKPFVSSEVLVTAGANLLGIAIIVGHERAHVVTSKALGFVKQLR